MIVDCCFTGRKSSSSWSSLPWAMLNRTWSWRCWCHCCCLRRWSSGSSCCCRCGDCRLLLIVVVCDVVVVDAVIACAADAVKICVSDKSKPSNAPIVDNGNGSRGTCGKLAGEFSLFSPPWKVCPPKPPILPNIPLSQLSIPDVPPVLLSASVSCLPMPISL